VAISIAITEVTFAIAIAITETVISIVISTTTVWCLDSTL
jgi:uncharacterized membrane protein (DUF485 family)